ncbi:energy-dependent translational throttle protein EttA [Pseudomonas sp. FW306-02-F02-AA]|uniref:ABC transporter ATP-binding protein n=1 Tax=Pseudomonas fluorescens TaxID=294 RepID=A0A0N9WMF4_PSEFL|nr:MULTISPECIES: ABC-F family ATP-binding cassette domain-containing protein [Pseudomonas]ALI04536.1 ABC transporter ATP-binding protein [Pseudomonas fluorescens]PMZ02400.1 energy-dependent translational throttle protein EttA [Pseudomonas sp. FW306-02-F02-AB]PMZ06614.1 energy-dependent translational throttle protein EttA [Pseudomonas sp. FW306-02-H06C]PMZ12517.1 energy-dependent translational throttle protein EttA [Pseudomonas sp. FW306-02-F02-AA]PMZ18519.1 energy-dependent translational throt
MTHVTRLPVLVTLNQLSYQLANGETLFDSLNLHFDHRPTGIVGRNGVGKSVLARLIAGDLTPASGTLSRFGSVAYVAQEPIAISGQSVAQAAGIAETLDALARLASGSASTQDLEQAAERWDLPEQLRLLFDEAGLPELMAQHPMDALSGGQRARIALIGAFLSQADLLVLDEPTNHLDADGRRWLMDRLDHWRGGVIVVSHDRTVLNSLQRIVELSALGVQVFGGNHAAYLEQREVEQAAAHAALEHNRTLRSRELKRLQREHDTIQRRAAGSRKNAETANVSRFERARMKGAATKIMGHVRHAHQAQKSAMNEQVREANARIKPSEPVLMTLPGTAVPANRQVITLIDAQLPWLAPEAPTTFLTISLAGPVRIALSGPNGCGKSTLLKMLAAHCNPVSGDCLTHVPNAYLDQRLELLDPERSIVEQLNLLDTPLSEGSVRSRLAQLQLDAVRVNVPTRLLSGGERLKAAIAIALWRENPAQLLLLDEPTNHLDLVSVQALEQALRDFPGALIAASHDTEFLRALAPTHTLHWQPTGWNLQRVEARSEH